MAVWPLSHFKSGPFRLFDLTSISHVIDSPRDLFFSPISDSVSTFSANSLDNTGHSPPALLFARPPPTRPPLAPPLLARLRGVSDPSLFLPLWPLMVYFVSNLISASLCEIETRNFSAPFFMSHTYLAIKLLIFIHCPKVIRKARLGKR